MRECPWCGGAVRWWQRRVRTKEGSYHRKCHGYALTDFVDRMKLVAIELQKVPVDVKTVVNLIDGRKSKGYVEVETWLP